MAMCSKKYPDMITRSIISGTLKGVFGAAVAHDAMEIDDVLSMDFPAMVDSNVGKTMPALHHPPGKITIFIGGINKPFPGNWVVNMALFYHSLVNIYH